MLTHHRHQYLKQQQQPIGEIGSVHLIMTMHGVHTTLSKQVMKPYTTTTTIIVVAQ